MKLKRPKEVRKEKTYEELMYDFMAEIGFMQRDHVHQDHVRVFIREVNYKDPHTGFETNGGCLHVTTDIPTVRGKYQPSEEVRYVQIEKRIGTTASRSFHVELSKGESWAEFKEVIRITLRDYWQADRPDAKKQALEEQVAEQKSDLVSNGLATERQQEYYNKLTGKKLSADTTRKEASKLIADAMDQKGVKVAPRGYKSTKESGDGPTSPQLGLIRKLTGINLFDDRAKYKRRQVSGWIDHILSMDSDRNRRADWLRAAIKKEVTK